MAIDRLKLIEIIGQKIANTRINKKGRIIDPCYYEKEAIAWEKNCLIQEQESTS